MKLRHLIPLLAASLLATSTQPALADTPAHEADVVIYGGTSAGIIAAIQAAKMGKTAILIEPTEYLGGLTTGGLGATDSGSKAAIGGLSREFYQRIHHHYSHPESWPLQKPDDLKSKSRKSMYTPEADAMWVFEPKVAARVYDVMLKEIGAPVTVVLQQRLNRETGVKKTDAGRITALVMESGETYKGRIFIDATYEGDLFAAAGTSYHVGREPNDRYEEELNGVQKAQMKGHLFLEKVDPYLVPGDPSSGLVARVHGDSPGEDGAGDQRMQAYNYRMCMSNDERNRVPFPKPEGYDEKQYELLFRNFEAGDLRMPWSATMMPNHKTDTNNYGAFSTDNIGYNYDFPEASYAEREKILAEHEQYQKGLMWTLANHPRVPEQIRKDMQPWGLAADEFTATGNWPHQIYVREGRRLIGEYVTTELDCRRVRVAEDSIGLGSYNMDSHNVQRYVTEDGYVQNEGDVQVSPGGPYVVSYRSIVPKKSECDNLLVPVCLSSSHIAYGSIRMEPVFMILGQSAATAAAMAIDADLAVQDVPYSHLRERLLEDGQVLDLPPTAKPKVLITSEKLPGIVIDDQHAKAVGAWTLSSSHPVFVDTGYLHDVNEGKGMKSLTFTADLPSAGTYEVRFAFPFNGNRSSTVPVTIRHAGGEQTVTVNQRRDKGDDTGFISLGEFEFKKGPAVVTVSNKGTKDGHVVADAVQFLAK